MSNKPSLLTFPSMRLVPSFLSTRIVEQFHNPIDNTIRPGPWVSTWLPEGDVRDRP
jgi:hypothetical protein